MKIKLITLNSEVGAYALKGLLESVKIEVFLISGDTNSLSGTPSSKTYVAYTLYIQESDNAAAQQLLKDFNFHV